MIFDTDKIEHDEQYRNDLRHRCITDHFFLAEVMGFKEFRPSVHREAVDLYFPKNPAISIVDQHPIKKRMHLDPRGTFKSTLGRVDSMQWILAFPDYVTILNETATQPLARELSKGIADYFWIGHGGPRTILQRLFPELQCAKEPFATLDTWNSPTRRFDPSDIQKTLAYTSVESVQSGWHPWIMNPDDMAETKNSGISATDAVRRKVIDVYDQNENLLRAGGYINVRGTRYHPFDLYGHLLDNMDSEMWKILIRTSLTVKSGARLLPGEFPDEEDVIMNFAELPGNDYRAMRAKFYANYESFMCQQQNDPQGGHVPKFDDKLWASCLVTPERIPRYGRGAEVYTCWRLPYGGKDNMKNAEGAAALVRDGKVYVTDCWVSTATPSGLAERMVHCHKQTDADAMMILYTPGSEYMATLVRNEAARRNASVKLTWVDWEEDDHRRTAAIEQMEPLMKVGRLLFSTAMTNQMKCKEQFVHFGLVPENGIIECVSKLADMVPLSQMRASMEEDELEWQRRRREDAQLSAFMAQQGMPEVDEQAKQKVQAHLAAMERTTSFSMPPLPGGLDG
jgi:hypothetical protein